MSDVSGVKTHIQNLRHKLKGRGENILATLYNKQWHYIHVRLLRVED